MCLGINAFALSGRVITNMAIHPQGVATLALGYVVVGLSARIDHQRDNSTRHWIIDSQLNPPSTIRETTQLAVGCQLYSKYHLMDDEISFVEKMIKPME